jgi:hypothetical protein
MTSRARSHGVGWCVFAVIALLAAECASGQATFRLEPTSVIEKRLRSFADDNQTREDTIHTWFAESGCAKANLSERTARLDLPPNVICVLPGETAEVIVVGAHTDKVDTAGDGVVDNWSGAALLPSLFFSLSGQKRHHTFVFVGFTGEELGLVGSDFYVSHLSRDRQSRIEAMVNLDSLGLGPTKVWASHADRILLDALRSAAASSKLSVETFDVDKNGTTDSESFARYHIPRITLHSVTQQTIHILHSDDDRLSAIKLDDYYNSYRLVADYLAYLDDILKPASSSPSNKSAL